MKQFGAFIRLAHRDQGLLLKAVMTLLICRARLHTGNIESLQSWATRVGSGTSSIDSLLWAVEVASRIMPGATCLCRALALQRMLAKNGLGSELRIGVEKNGGRFVAHAWLTRGDQVLVGAVELSKYELLAVWPSRAAVSEKRQKGADRS